MAPACGHCDSGTDRFPLRLLALGYATAALAALTVHLQYGGLLAVVLTFWLGGAVATLAWGALYVYIARRREARIEPPGLTAGALPGSRPQARAVKLPGPRGAVPTPAPMRQ